MIRESQLPSAGPLMRPTMLRDPLNDHRRPGYWSAHPRRIRVGCGNGAEGLNWEKHT